MDYSPGTVLVLGVSKGVAMSEGFGSEAVGLRISCLQNIAKALMKWAYTWELVLDSEGPAALLYDDQSESAKDWLRNNSEKLSTAAVLDESKFDQSAGLIIPSVLGFLGSRDNEQVIDVLAPWVCACVEAKKPLVLAGYGLVTTFGASQTDSRWVLNGYNLTSVPIVTQFGESYAEALPYFIEETVREKGGVFASSSTGLMIVDRKVISLQTELAMGMAVHSLCVMIKEGR